MNQRLGRPPGRKEQQELCAAPLSGPVRILGIDPSLRATGYGVIGAEGKDCSHIDSGTIACPRGRLSQCLGSIAERLSEVIERTCPGICVIEGIFYAQNMKTALVMGEVRGVCIAAASRAGLPVFEIPPSKVKKAMVGFGGAGKRSVARMVEFLLCLESTPPPDAGDALALALAWRMESRFGSELGPSPI